MKMPLCKLGSDHVRLRVKPAKPEQPGLYFTAAAHNRKWVSVLRENG